MQPTDLITPEQLAAEWQISPKTLANQRSAGIGPPYLKLNGTIRYSRKAIEEYKARRTVTPEPAA